MLAPIESGQRMLGKCYSIMLHNGAFATVQCSECCSLAAPACGIPGFAAKTDIMPGTQHTFMFVCVDVHA